MLPSERCQQIHKERGTTRAHPGTYYDMVAQLWSVYLKVPISKYDAVQMQCLLKVAREKALPHVDPDNVDDQAGYADVYRMMEEADGSFRAST